MLALLVGAGTFVGGLLAAPIDFAVPAPPTSVLLLAADGRQIATIAPPERREVVPAEQIPAVMREAIISAEDERFLKHRGIDPLATLRAAFRDLTGGTSQGGSTLTQQYVKNVYVGNERTALRKVREAALAVRLEQKFTKQQILTSYLNALYLGNGLYGVQAASKYYFGVPVKDLDLDTVHHVRDRGLGLARATIMAGIAPAPSAWNPVHDFATARARQQYTLNRMVVGGFATPQEVSAAYQKDVTPLKVTPPVLPSAAPEYTDIVKAQLRTKYAGDEDAFFRGGLRVRTTLDLDLQNAVTQALREVLPDPQDPQAAVVAVDYRTGAVKAMTTLHRVPATADRSGKVRTPAIEDYAHNTFNVATRGHRSTGSTIKPFTLAQALIEGQSLSTSRYAPHCLDLANPGGAPDPYHFCNSEPSEAGTFTLRSALAHSVNTVYLPLAKEVGRGKVASLAKRAGLVGDINPGNLSFGIGAGVEVTPLSEASAYGTFADGGLHVAPRYYTQIRTGGNGTDPGQVVADFPPPAATRVMSPQVAGDVVSAMTDVVAYGTGTSAAQPFPVFGKTGTTDGSTDAWFTACVPQQSLCIATWMGYEKTSCADARTGVHVVGGACGGMLGLHGVRQVFGGTLPAKVFARSQEILRGLQSARAAAAPGVPPATPTASATPFSLPALPQPASTPTYRRRRFRIPRPFASSAGPATQTPAPVPTLRATALATPPATTRATPGATPRATR